jgi:hypothetical protein
MQQLTFNREITVEDKYREFDLGLLVHANIIEDKVLGYPTEFIVNIKAVEVDDARDVTPYENGDNILSRLDSDTIEYLKDEAVKEMI